jgi:YidC/Oxa1 family membrane protein insertase
MPAHGASAALALLPPDAHLDLPLPVPVKPPLSAVFQPLINVFETILKVFHDDVGMSWGLAIIALDGAHPLSAAAKQARSMSRIAQLSRRSRTCASSTAPIPSASSTRRSRSIERTRSTRARVAVADGGAAAGLPLALLHAAHRLRHDICPAINPPRTPAAKSCGETAASHFLFIPDLTSRATGAVLVALIALYVGSQLLSILTSANPTTDTTQRRILLALPFVFVSIAWQLPAGLLLYWITTNAWTVGQGAIMHKRLGSPQQAATAKGGRLGDLSSNCSPVTGTSHRFAAADHEQRRLDNQHPHPLGPAPQEARLASRALRPHTGTFRGGAGAGCLARPARRGGARSRRTVAERATRQRTWRCSVSRSSSARSRG